MPLRRCLTVIAIVSLTFSAATGYGQTLMELYELARVKDPAIKRSQARLDAEQENSSLAYSQILPRVDASSGYTFIGHTVYNYAPGVPSGNYDGYNYGVNLKQPIINGPAWSGLDRAEYGIKAAEAALSGARQDLMLRVAEAYLAFLKARSGEQISAGEKARLGEVLVQAKAFLKEGTGDIVAVHEAQARYDMAAANLTIAESDRRVAEKRLSILADVPVTQVPDLGPITPEAPDPANEAAWLEMTDKNNAAIIEARFNVDRADVDVTTARRGHWPTVDLNAGYNVNKGSTFLPDMIISQWSIGASVVLPIFHGGATDAQARQAVANVSANSSALDDAVMQARMKTEAAFLSQQSSVLILNSLEQIVHSAEKQLEAVRVGRKIGTRTSVDLLNAEQIYTASLRNHASFGYDHLLFRLRLKAAAGVLRQEDLQAVAAIPGGQNPGLAAASRPEPASAAPAK